MLPEGKGGLWSLLGIGRGVAAPHRLVPYGHSKMQ